MTSDPDEPVVVTETLTGFEAETIANALRAHDIPAQTAGTATRMAWGAAIEMVKVMVRRRDLQRAQNALRAIKADSVDIDWDQVDVGEADTAAFSVSRWRARLLFSAGVMLALGITFVVVGRSAAGPGLGNAGIAAFMTAALFAILAGAVSGPRPESSPPAHIEDQPDDDDDAERPD